MSSPTPDDLASMSDMELIFAMGGHVQSCGCLRCDEWRRRNLFNVPLVALTWQAYGQHRRRRSAPPDSPKD